MGDQAQGVSHIQPVKCEVMDSLLALLITNLSRIPDWVGNLIGHFWVSCIGCKFMYVVTHARIACARGCVCNYTLQGQPMS